VRDGLRLLGPRVVVRADLPAERVGLIHVPDVARRQPLRGTVALVGQRATSEVALGDTVLFGHHAWSRFNAPGYGFPYMLLWERDVLAVLEP